MKTIPARVVQMNELWDDEMLRIAAWEHGYELPTPGQCNNIRQQRDAKIAAAIAAGKTNLHISTDGRSVFIDDDNVGSLYRAFCRKRRYIPPVEAARVAAEYHATIGQLTQAEWTLTSGLIGLCRNNHLDRSVVPNLRQIISQLEAEYAELYHADGDTIVWHNDHPTINGSGTL